MPHVREVVLPSLFEFFVVHVFCVYGYQTYPLPVHPPHCYYLHIYIIWIWEGVGTGEIKAFRNNAISTLIIYTANYYIIEVNTLTRS